MNGTRAAIKHVPNDDDNFDDIIKSINGLIGDKAQYLKLRSCEGTDGWTYGVLSSDDWGSLEAKIPNLIRMLFVNEASVTVVEGDLLDQIREQVAPTWPYWSENSPRLAQESLLDGRIAGRRIRLFR